MLYSIQVAHSDQIDLERLLSFTPFTYEENLLLSTQLDFTLDEFNMECILYDLLLSKLNFNTESVDLYSFYMGEAHEFLNRLKVAKPTIDRLLGIGSIPPKDIVGMQFKQGYLTVTTNASL